MALSKEQSDQLAELERLRDEPEQEETGGGISRILNVSVDLGDDAQVERAIKLGFLTAPAADDEPADDDPPEDGPRRRGYFPEDEK